MGLNALTGLILASDINIMTIKEKIYNYPTRHKEGFIWSEIECLIKEYNNFDMDKFKSAMNGNTCMMIDDEIIHYHCDVFKALLCGIEKRNLRPSEWD